MRTMDSDIIAEIQAGDTEKFGLLYDAYFERIYKYLFYRTFNKEIAEDLVSATFFKAVQAIPSFKADKGTFSAWLYRIARNTLYDHHRSKKQNVPLEYAAELVSSSNLEGEFADKEMVSRVKDLMGHLTPEQKEIISMRVTDELPYSEIAEVTGKSVASCKMTFYRGVAKLKSAI